MCEGLGINLAPREFNKRVHITEEKYNLINKVNKEAGKVLESWIIHEPSRRIEMSSELWEFLNSNQQALKDIVSETIQNEPPVWELDIERHIYALPPLSGQITLQRLINLKASLLIKESKYVEAEQMLEASWKINEDNLERPEEITYKISQIVLRLQQGNLRQIPIASDVWHERLKTPEIGMQLWKVLEGNVWAMLKAADEGALLKDEKGKKGVYGVIFSPYYQLMIFDWAEVMHSRIVELNKCDPCSPMKPIKMEEAKRLFASWNRMGFIFHDPAELWNRSMRFLLELELTNKILEIKKNSNALAHTFSFDSEICKGQKWNFKKTTDGFELSLSKEIDWSIADFPKTTFFLPDKYTIKKDSANSALKTNVDHD